MKSIRSLAPQREEKLPLELYAGDGGCVGLKFNPVYNAQWKETGEWQQSYYAYLMIYASLITLSVRNGVILPIILYALAICLFVFLCLIGIFSNLKNAKVHWVIEISNVVCQFSVALATVILR